APSMTSQRFVPISGAWCRRQGGHSYRPLVLPEEDRAYAPRLVGIAWLFPGQGSQSVGMGKDLAARYPTAARVFEEANDALGFDLRALCFDGPQEELDRTANTQPALLATSLAALRAAQEAGAIGEPAMVLGHSLGEFTAIVAASALTLADALGLVRTRGELMQAADSNGGIPFAGDARGRASASRGDEPAHLQPTALQARGERRREGARACPRASGVAGETGVVSGTVGRLGTARRRGRRVRLCGVRSRE